MASLVLVPVIGAIGAAVIPGTMFGVSLGLVAGQVVGGLLGGWIDSMLFGSTGQGAPVEGPRLDSLKVTSSTEGSPVPRLYGRMRLGGQVIWATNLEEVVSTDTQGGGGKGGVGGGGGGTKVTEYKYYANFAVAICEGEVATLGRVWADGKELELSDYNYRFYRGTETQMPDSLMEEKEGSGNVPAYRGVCYIVFEGMPLASFGNRIPQLNFEVFRSVDGFEETIRAITILPGSGEFVYGTEEYRRGSFGSTQLENVHTRRGGTDWEVSIDDMEAVFENLDNAALVVSWFGSDLRCNSCTIRPKVDNAAKITTPNNWGVAGYTRSTAGLISIHNDSPAFGGTPDDETVKQAITDLKARGLGVTFYPFIMMDIPQGNSLPDPYSEFGVGQSVYPWRGRITLSKAPGVAGSPDGTATAATQVAAFVTEFRAFILHYANLCASVGGVDAFYIGTEMRGLTWIRGASNSFPFVSALVTLAADVKAILPGAKITYGADWSEYFGYSTGGGEFFFHLDPLWSSSDISAIAIDCYWPLSDWRQGSAHLDRLAGHRSIYDKSYLKGNIQGGEGYDWYYASQADRDDQVRTPITDGAYGKPWVWRYKDVKSWWLNQHFNRPGGVQSGSATAWVPQSKPIWFSELGCPALNLGSNQPNVFYDPKSSESFFPYYSNGVRDDFMQRRHIQAFCEFWDTAHEDYVAGANPVSSVYGQTMVDLSRIYIYTWDARPYPAFPYALDVWSDGTNWPYGHWLNGRIGGGSLDGVVRAILQDYGFSDFNSSALVGQVDGYALDRVMSVRDALGPLEVGYFFDSFESEGIIKFRHRGYLGSQIDVPQEIMVDTNEGGDPTNKLFEITRGQETELPLSTKLTYYDGQKDYQSATVEARRLTVKSDRVANVQMPIVARQALAQSIADVMLQETWVSRERAQVVVPPSLLFLEPTDVIRLMAHNRAYKFRIIGINDSGPRAMELMQIDTSIYDGVRGVDRNSTVPTPLIYGPPTTFYMDLPMLSDSDTPYAGYVAAFADPWPGAVFIYRSADTSGYVLNTVLGTRATIGKTLYDLYPGPEGRWDYANSIIVEVSGGTLSSVTELELLSGKNACAIRNGDGDWEIIQFLNAELVSAGTYRLTTLLRGQLGTEHAMRSPVPASSDWVLLNAAVRQVDMQTSDILLSYNWKDGPHNRTIDDNSYNSLSLAFEGEGLRAYSPTDVQLEMDNSDNIVVSWKRRTRIGGDNWDVEEVPLGEEYEKYRLVVYAANQVTVLRTVDVTTPSYTYTVAQYTTDFGSAPNDLYLSVAQVTPYGTGTPRKGLVVVDRVVP